MIKSSFLSIDRKIFDDNHYRDNLDNNAIMVYILLGDRMKVSIKNKWIDPRNNQCFCYYDTDKICHEARIGRTKYFKIRGILHNLGLMNWLKDPNKPSWRIFLPKFTWRTPKSSHSELYSNNKSSNNKSTGNTVNTKTGKPKRKFKSSSATNLWKDSAKKMGLTFDTIDMIARFSDTYNQNAYKVTGFIKEARDIVANKYHIKKKARHFETNQNIIDHLGKKLRILFSHIISKDDHKARLSNYAGFLINSLKRFFKWTFGKGKDETVKPKTDNRHASHYRKRKPIKEDIPQWMKDEKAGKTPKPKKTDKLLTNLIQARNAYDTVAMQADDPMKPNPDHGKIATLKKRVKRYEKLYNAKRKEAKPTPKPKQHKQAKELPKTDPALQRKIHARLRRLGEC